MVEQTTSPDQSKTSEPRELHPTSDIRFVIRDLGELAAKVDRLIQDTNKNTAAIQLSTKKIATFETTVKISAVALSVGGAIFWWLFSDYVRVVVEHAITYSFLHH